MNDSDYQDGYMAAVQGWPYSYKASEDWQQGWADGTEDTYMIEECNIRVRSLKEDNE